MASKEKNIEIILTANNIVPEVGMGVTSGYGSDCYPHTIVAVDPNLMWIEITDDKTTPCEGFDFYNNQHYICTPDPEAESYRLKLHTRGPKAGRYGDNYWLGHRRYYQDPSF
jgi:hypothetical protein